MSFWYVVLGKPHIVIEYSIVVARMIYTRPVSGVRLGIAAYKSYAAHLRLLFFVMIVAVLYTAKTCGRRK